MSRQRKEKPTWADLRREVREAKGVMRPQGATSHEIWVLPSGGLVTLQSKHPTEQVTKRVRNNIRALLDAEPRE